MSHDSQGAHETHEHETHDQRVGHEEHNPHDSHSIQDEKDKLNIKSFPGKHDPHSSGLDFLKKGSEHRDNQIHDKNESHGHETEEPHFENTAVFKLRKDIRYYVAVCMGCSKQNIYELRQEKTCCMELKNLKFMRTFNDEEEAKNFIKYQEV